MVSISVEALIGILLLVLVVAIFHTAFGVILQEQKTSIMQQCIEKRAASTALLATVYSYTISHGYFNPSLVCSVGDRAVCKDNKVIATAPIYKRKGGGN